MEKTRLQALLKELHRELAGGRPIDAESRRLLDDVVRDIEMRAGEAPGNGDPGPAAQLEAAALRLESEHPRLAAILGQLGDALAKLGI